MALPTTIEVYEGLKKTTEEKIACLMILHDTNVDILKASKEVTDLKNSIIVEYSDLTKHPDGQKELGSNDAARTATIENLVSSERKHLESLELHKQRVQGQLTIVSLELDMWRWTMDLLKIESNLSASTTAL